MIQSNNRTFLQILRSDAFDVDDFIRNELNAVAEILEEYHVNSASELQKELQKKKARSTAFDAEAFLNECGIYLRRREAGENVDEQINALVETFNKNEKNTKLSGKKIIEFATEFGLSFEKKDKVDSVKSKFRTWLQTGQKPLTKEQECLLEYEGRWHKIYNASNKTTDGCLPQEDIEQLVALVQEIPAKVVKIETLKSFLSGVGIENITGNQRNTIVNNLRKRLEGNDSASKKSSSRPQNTTPKVTQEEKLESYKQQVLPLREKLECNLPVEVRKDVVQQIIAVVQDANDGSNKLNKEPFILFVQDTFGYGLKKQSTKSERLTQTIEYVKKCFLSSPAIQQEEKQETKIESLEQTAENVIQCVSSSPAIHQGEKQEREKSDTLEDDIREARRLRADGMISKIVDLAKTVKNKYKVEGLIKFMDGLGVKSFNTPPGKLIDEMEKRLNNEVYLRFKFNHIQEMK